MCAPSFLGVTAIFGPHRTYRAGLSFFVLLITVDQKFESFFIFKLEEEEKPALLLHLPKLFAETAVFCSASGFGCRLVVAFPQGSAVETAIF
jgi:hypothetical protein